VNVVSNNAPLNQIDGDVQQVLVAVIHAQARKYLHSCLGPAKL